MPKLFGIMITKDDDLIIGPWLEKHSHIFEKIAIVDGSTSNYTKDLSSKFSNIVYCRDPDSHITDQTLRNEAWKRLRPYVSLGDWIFLCHADEFYIHDPRSILNNPDLGNLVFWLPLVILPHPDEAGAWIKSKSKDATTVFKHFWWKAGENPHVEHRMWRFVKEPFWNLEIRKPSCGVIPHNYASEKISSVVPIYLHYRCYNLDLSAYNSSDGSYKKSAFTQGIGAATASNHGIGRMVNNFEDFFFYEDRPPAGKNQVCLNFNEKTLEVFGNPPKFALNQSNQVVLVNDFGVDVTGLFIAGATP